MLAVVTASSASRCCSGDAEGSKTLSVGTETTGSVVKGVTEALRLR